MPNPNPDVNLDELKGLSVRDLSHEMRTLDIGSVIALTKHIYTKRIQDLQEVAPTEDVTTSRLENQARSLFVMSVINRVPDMSDSQLLNLYVEVPGTEAYKSVVAHSEGSAERYRAEANVSALRFALYGAIMGRGIDIKHLMTQDGGLKEQFGDKN